MFVSDIISETFFPVFWNQGRPEVPLRLINIPGWVCSKKKQFFSSLDHTTSCNWLLSKKEVISYIKIWLAAFFVLNGMAYSQQRHFFPRKWTFTRSWYWINYSQQRPIGHHDKHLKVILVSYTFVDVRYFWVFFLFN